MTPELQKGISMVSQSLVGCMEEGLSQAKAQRQMNCSVADRIVSCFVLPDLSIRHRTRLTCIQGSVFVAFHRSQ